MIQCPRRRMEGKHVLSGRNRTLPAQPWSEVGLYMIVVKNYKPSRQHNFTRIR